MNNTSAWKCFVCGARPSWDFTHAFELGNAGGKKFLPKGVAIVERDNFHHEVNSVEEAVEGLNCGRLTAHSGMCIVLCGDSRKYFMVCRSDMVHEAHAICDKGYVALARCRASELSMSLPPPLHLAIDAVATRAGMDNEVIVWALTGVLLLFWLTPDIVTLEVIGTLYPVWMTLKMLGQERSEDTRFWAAYWLLFSCLKSGPVDDLLRYFVPFWSYSKLVMIFALYSPQTRGASFVYKGWRLLVGSNAKGPRNIMS